MTRKSSHLIRLALLITIIQGGSIALSSSIHMVPKPTDSAPELRARTQPTVPENYREIPFIEKAPVPELTAEEQARGYLLFQRPIMEPVYSNTNASNGLSPSLHPASSSRSRSASIPCAIWKT